MASWIDPMANSLVRIVPNWRTSTNDGVNDKGKKTGYNSHLSCYNTTNFYILVFIMLFLVSSY